MIIRKVNIEITHLLPFMNPPHALSVNLPKRNSAQLICICKENMKRDGMDWIYVYMCGYILILRGIEESTRVRRKTGIGREMCADSVRLVVFLFVFYLFVINLVYFITLFLFFYSRIIKDEQTMKKGALCSYFSHRMTSFAPIYVYICMYGRCRYMFSACIGAPQQPPIR